MSDAEFWLELGTEELQLSLAAAKRAFPAHARNVVVFLGDGLSLATVTAARWEA